MHILAIVMMLFAILDNVFFSYEIYVFHLCDV